MKGLFLLKLRLDELQLLVTFYKPQPSSNGLQHSDGLQLRSNGFQPRSNALQPNSNGLQPNRNGLQPYSDGPQT